ncbi:MAG: hypothetical protein EP329_17390 [Deltaproteobacteria bacterium]|nr:MAG: hypothetical protein EP329_17390 [Deltaproteobacteria bacterium]
MFDDTTPPVMRGDLFALLDPEVSKAPLTPDRIAEAARALVDQVTLGERAPGAPILMECLGELAGVSSLGVTAGAAFGVLEGVRTRLVSLGGVRSSSLPFARVRERAVVLPQRRSASLVRALPSGDGYFVLTREATAATETEEPEIPEGRPESDDEMALGPARVPPVDVTFRLFRFGAEASDIRMVIRIVQEAGTYRRVLCAGDGERLAVLSRDVVAVFDPEGQSVLSGRVPLDPDVDSGAEVTAMALEGDILALNLRSGGDRPVELALLNIAERKGLPVGVVGDEAAAVVLGDKRAYVIDGLNLLSVPLFQPGAAIDVFRLRPWFAEYPWRPYEMLAWDAGRIWVTNGEKIVVAKDDLSAVVGEIVLPEPVVDFHVHDGELSLVTFDPALSVARITTWDVS